MDVYFFLKHFYDVASAPFVEAKRRIEAGEEPYDDPPYDESGVPPYLAEWMQAEVEHELVGRAAVSMLSEALKQFFVTWERKGWTEPPCAKCFKKAFKDGFISGYVACFTEGFTTDWSTCPADLGVLKQVVLARNRSQHADLVLDHLSHDDYALAQFPKPFFVHPEEDGVEYDGNSFLAPTMHVGRTKLFEAIDHVERLCVWLQEGIEAHLYPNARAQHLTVRLTDPAGSSGLAPTTRGPART